MNTKSAGAAIFFLFASALPLIGEKVAEFQEPFAYPNFAIDEERLYVWDVECVIHIYDRKNYAHIGQFGRKGQGPPEFEYISYVLILPDSLCIGQDQKISYFSKTGEFLKTITNQNSTTGGYMPFGSNYVGTRYLPDDPQSRLVTLTVGLSNVKFESIRELYRADVQKNVYNFETGKPDVLNVRGCFKYEIHKDQLYLGNSEAGFFFRVFDSRGEKLYDIIRDYEKRKVSSGDMKEIIAGLRELMGESDFNRRKRRINKDVFPEFFPAYGDFTVADGKLYVFSFPMPKELITATVLDLRGNLLKETKVPWSPGIGASNDPIYRVYKGKYYYTSYNEGTEKWELHVADIDSPPAA